MNYNYPRINIYEHKSILTFVGLRVLRDFVVTSSFGYDYAIPCSFVANLRRPPFITITDRTPMPQPTTLASSPLDWPSLLRSRWMICLVLPLLWACAYLPHLGDRDLRQEEGRRATPALEMIRSGNYLTPTLYGEPYLNKPPLYFWTVAGLSRLTGTVDAWTVRFPSALAAVAGAWLICFFASRTLAPEARTLAALMFLASPIMLDKATLGEIDAFLSALVIGAFVAWWRGYDPRTVTVQLWSWIAAGIFLAYAGLTKGPAGLVEFYAMLGTLLLFMGPRHWKLLLTPGHFLCLTLALLPLLVWVFALIHHGSTDLATGGRQWADQLGFDVLTRGGPHPSPPLAYYLEHYKQFPQQVLSMTLPWCLLALVTLWPPLARQMGYTYRDADSAPTLLPRDPALRALWRWAIFGSLATFLLFYFHPASHARHAMVILFPLVVLAAVFAVTQHLHPFFSRLLPAVRTASLITAIVPAIVGLGVTAFAAIRFPSLLTSALPVAAIGIGASFLTFRLCRRSTLPAAPVAFAASLALAILLGRGAVANVFLPLQAQRDTTRQLHEQIARIVPLAQPVYTTRTFSTSLGDDYYNAQFYLPGQPIALNNFHDLPVGKTVTIISSPDQWPDLLSLDPAATRLGLLQTPKGPPPLLVTQLTRQSN